MADVDTSKIDFERMNALLNVVHQCAGVGPKLTSLSNAAMTELTKVNDSIRVAAMEAEKERREAEAKAEANRPKAQPTALTSAEDDATQPDPNEDLKNDLKPRAIPNQSGETIADRRI